MSMQLTVMEETMDELKLRVHIHNGPAVWRNVWAMDCEWLLLHQDQQLFLYLRGTRRGAPHFPIKILYELKGGLTAAGVALFHSINRHGYDKYDYELVGDSYMRAKLCDTDGSYDNVTCIVTLKSYEKWAILKEIDESTVVKAQMATVNAKIDQIQARNEAIYNENAKLKLENASIRHFMEKMQKENADSKQPFLDSIKAIKVFKSDLSCVQEVNLNLRAEYETVRSEIAAIKAENVELRNKLGSLNSFRSAILEEVRTLGQEMEFEIKRVRKKMKRLLVDNGRPPGSVNDGGQNCPPEEESESRFEWSSWDSDTECGRSSEPRWARRLAEQIRAIADAMPAASASTSSNTNGSPGSTSSLDTTVHNLTEMAELEEITVLDNPKTVIPDGPLNWSAYIHILGTDEEANFQLRLDGNPHVWRAVSFFDCTWLLSSDNGRIALFLMEIDKRGTVPLIKYEITGGITADGTVVYENVAKEIYSAKILYNNDDHFNDVTCHLKFTRVSMVAIMNEQLAGMRSKRSAELTNLYEQNAKLSATNVAFRADICLLRGEVDQLRATVNSRQADDFESFKSEVVNEMTAIKSELSTVFTQLTDTYSEFLADMTSIQCENAKISEDYDNIQNNLDLLSKSTVMDELKQMKTEIDKVREEKAAVQRENTDSNPNNVEISEENEKLRRDLAGIDTFKSTIKDEIGTLRSELDSKVMAIQESINHLKTETELKTLRQENAELKEEIRRLKTANTTLTSNVTLANFSDAFSQCSPSDSRQEDEDQLGDESSSILIIGDYDLDISADESLSTPSDSSNSPNSNPLLSIVDNVQAYRQNI